MTNERARRAGLRPRWLVAPMLALGLLGTTVVVVTGSEPAAAAVSGAITGTVFRDFDGDGTLDAVASATAATDVGVGGVVVEAYSDAGELVGTATTGADGTYALAYAGAGTDPQVRVQFTVPAGYRPTARGTTGTIRSGTTVQFLTDGGTAHLGIAREGDYAQIAPDLVIPVQRGAGTNGVLAPGTSPSLVAVSYAASGLPAYGDGAGDQRVQATSEQTGALWGVANYGAAHVFTGALLKRHAPLGPGGLGAIYLTAISPVGGPSNPNASVFVQIPNVGPNPRTGVTGPGADRDLAGYDWERDPVVFDRIHKAGLGDVDLSADGKTLYAVNLTDRRVYAVPVIAPAAPGGAPTAGTPVALDLPLGLPGATPCAPDQVRPFGLEANSQGLWVTLTCTGPLLTDLRAYVYRYDPTSGSFDPGPAIDVPLGGNRGNIRANAPLANSANWRAWNDTFDTNHGAITATTFIVDPQPLVSDLTFDSNGDMTIGIKDRNGDQSGAFAFDVDPANDTLYEAFTAGDALRLCRNAADTAWVLEDNGSCGTRTGNGPNNGQGPGGGEFYNDNLGTGHQQIFLGSVEQVPGFTAMISTAFDPIANVRRSGFQRDANATGADLGGVDLTGDGWGSCAQCVGTFAKSDGVGDIEALLAPAPIEIGNRVWLDVDRDGVQDPGEAPIAGVTVHLYQGATLVGTAVTDADGEYSFNAGTVPGGVLPETDYRIALDRPEDRLTGGPLFDVTPTVATADPDAGIDSDGVVSADGWPEVSLTTGTPGANDHTFDFGFTPGVFDLALRKTLATGQGATVDPNSAVTFAIRVFNQGTVPATAIEVTDTLPPGTTLEDPDWIDNGDGTATIVLPGPLAPGASTAVDITIRLPRSAAVGTLINDAEISAAQDQDGHPAVDIDSTPNTDPDDDELVDDEIDSTPAGTPSDEDDHDIAEVTVRPLAPSIDIEKGDAAGNDADTAAASVVVPEGDETSLAFAITNTGDEPLVDVTVTDAVTGGDATVTGLSCDFTPLGGPATGTTWAGPFEVDESFTCIATLSALTPGVHHVDVGAVEAAGRFTATPVDDDDPYHADTTPIPSIGIEKGDAAGNDADTDATAVAVADGATTALVFTVTNDGNEDLVNVVVTDAVTLGNATVTALSCDFSPLGGPASGTTWAGPFAADGSFTCTATLSALTPGIDHIDVGTVTGVGRYSGTPVDDDDPYRAETPPAPGIDIEKADAAGNDADTTATAVAVADGATTALVFTVTNDGNEDLVNVAVTDTVTGGSATVTDLSCDFSPLGGPSSGTTWAGPFGVDESFTCTATLAALTPGLGHVDLGEVTGTGRYSGSPVDDDDPYHAEVPLVSVGDHVWFDVDRDGTQDPGEPPVAGVVVNLYDSTGSLVATTTTDEDGFYSFTDLTAATEYRIEFVPPTGASFTIGNAGGDDGLDSDADVTTGSTVVFTTPATGSNSATEPDDPTWDAGFVQLDLTITKRLVTTGPFVVGQRVTYELVPHNNGPVDALPGWSVTDVLPAGLTLVSISGAGYSCELATATCVDVTGEPFASGADGGPIAVVATIDADAGGTLHNVAYVSPADGDIPETNLLDRPSTGTNTDDSPTNNDAQAVLVIAPPPTTTTSTTSTTSTTPPPGAVTTTTPLHDGPRPPGGGWPLPRTGAEVQDLLRLAAVLGLSGAGLLGLARRRRRSARSA